MMQSAQDRTTLMRPAVSATRYISASLFKDKRVRDESSTWCAEYHDMINAFPADRSDQPFSVCVLPG